jgi:hypothetical protein
MTYAVTGARRKSGDWVSHLPSFTVEAFSEEEAKQKARDIIGRDCYEPALSVAAL